MGVKKQDGMLVKCGGKVIFRERIDPMNIQLKKGVMEIVVLSMLQRKDFYGYELVPKSLSILKCQKEPFTRF